mgnify:CR=1 FL=1
MKLPPLVAELIAKTDAFQAGMARAAESAQRSSGDITGAMGKIQAALGSIGVGLSVAALGASIQQTTALGDELYKMSQRVGVSVENLSTLRYALDLGGISAADMNAGLIKLNKKLGEAGSGSEEAAKYLKQFGIEAADIKNGTLSADEALKRIADRFASSPDGINKTTQSLELLGKAGGTWIPVLNGGREALEGLQTEAEKLGLKMSTETARRMESFNDQLRTLQFATEGAKIALVSDFLPAIEGITKAMRDATVEGGKFAGLMAGLRTALTGTDQYKNDKRLVELTEKKLQLENDIAGARKQGNGVRVLTFGAELGRVEAELKTTLTYRKSLEETAAVEVAAAKQRDSLKNNGRQLEGVRGAGAAVKAAKDRTSEFEREARLMVEGEQAAIDDINGAWKAWEEQQTKESEETTKALAEQWKQVFAEIDAEQERAIDGGRKYLDALKDDTKDATKFARDLGLTFSSAFEQAVIDGGKFSDVLKGLAKDVQRIFLRKSVTEPLADGLTGAFKNIFGSGGPEQLAGPTGGGLFDDALKFMGFRADGGPVTAGGAYVVGERGPELFIPRNSGAIVASDGGAGRGVPNNAMGGQTFNFDIDARGADAGVEQRIQAAVRQAVSLSVAAVRSQADRGGSYARSVGRR